MIREHNFQDQLQNFQDLLHNFQDQFCNFQDSPDKAGFKGTESWEGEGEFCVMDKILVMMMMTLLMMLQVKELVLEEDVECGCHCAGISQNHCKGHFDEVMSCWWWEC